MDTGVREARAGDAARIADIHVESWRNTYRGIMPDSFLDGMSTARSRIGWDNTLASLTGGSKVFVHEDEAAVVNAFVHFGPGRDSAMPFPCEIYAIYVDLPGRGRGTGTKLLDACAKAAAAAGWNGMYLWAAAKNTYSSFYLKNGGERGAVKTKKIAGTDVALEAFCWPDLKRHLERAVSPTDGRKPTRCN